MIARMPKKMSPFTVLNGIFKKVLKYSISKYTRFSQTKYHIPSWKTETGSLKQKNISVIQGKNRKIPINSEKNENFEKHNNAFFMSQGSLQPKNRSLGQKVFSVVREQTYTQTDTQTYTQTWKWIQRTPFQCFRIFFLQPVIKDRSNKCHSPILVGRILVFFFPEMPCS